MDERRLTVRLMNQWAASQKDNTLPRFEDFETADFRTVWRHCVVLRIENLKNNQLICERMGAQIIEACGRDMTGQVINQRTEKFPEVVIFNNIEEVCKGLAPIEGVGQFTAPDGAIVKWRACFMPFGNGDNVPTHITVGFTFKRE